MKLTISWRNKKQNRRIQMSKQLSGAEDNRVVQINLFMCLPFQESSNTVNLRWTKTSGPQWCNVSSISLAVLCGEWRAPTGFSANGMCGLMPMTTISNSLYSIVQITEQVSFEHSYKLQQPSYFFHV